jgi:hypothetical protein
LKRRETASGGDVSRLVVAGSLERAGRDHDDGVRKGSYIEFWFAREERKLAGEARLMRLTVSD